MSTRQVSLTGESVHDPVKVKGCPICEHLHRRMIEYMFEDGKTPESRICRFYEVDIDDLHKHKEHMAGVLAQ
jgi:hypothetical protein